MKSFVKINLFYGRYKYFNSKIGKKNKTQIKKQNNTNSCYLHLQVLLTRKLLFITIEVHSKS